MNDYHNLKQFQSSISFELPENVEDEGKIIALTAYRRSKIAMFFTIVNTLLTCGLFFLICKWKLNLRIHSTMKKTNMNKAEFLKIKCEDGTVDIIPIKNERIKVADLEEREIKVYKWNEFAIYFLLGFI